MVVNEEFARTFWRGENPLGRRIRLVGGEGEYYEVVGMVGNTLRGGAAARTVPEIYCAFDQFPTSNGALIIRTSGDPLAAAAAVREQIKNVSAQVIVHRPRMMTEILADTLSTRRLVRLLFGVFAGLALALAAVGIYGVVAFSVAHRAREIGVRMALGARPSAVMGMVMRQGLLPVLAGVVVGLAGSFALARYLKTLVYGVAPDDPVSLASAGVVLLAAGAIACWLPARRAAGIDPSAALREQ